MTKKDLPTLVYFVERTPPRDEHPLTRWGPLARLYRSWNHVRLFVTSNPRSSFKVYEAEVTWREVGADGTDRS